MTELKAMEFIRKKIEDGTLKDEDLDEAQQLLEKHDLKVHRKTNGEYAISDRPAGGMSQLETMLPYTVDLKPLTGEYFEKARSDLTKWFGNQGGHGHGGID